MPLSEDRSGVPVDGDPAEDWSAARLADAFGRTAKILSRTLDDNLSEYSRSTPRARALEVVAGSAEPARLADVMAQVGVGQATASTLIDGLVRDQLVTRQPDPNDGRALRLVPTDAGVAAATAWREAYSGLVEEIFGVLSARDCEALGRVLTRLADSALAVTGPRGTGGGRER